MPPLSRSLFLPLIAVCIVGPLTLTGLVMWLQGDQQTELLRSVQKYRLLDIGRHIARAGASEEAAETASITHDVRVELIDAVSLDVLFDTGHSEYEFHDTQVGRNASDDPDVYLARDSGSGTAEVLRNGSWRTFAAVLAGSPAALSEVDDTPADDGRGADGRDGNRRGVDAPAEAAGADEAPGTETSKESEAVPEAVRNGSKAEPGPDGNVVLPGNVELPAETVIVRTSSPTFRVPGNPQGIVPGGELLSSPLFWSLAFGTILLSAVAGGVVAQKIREPITTIARTIQDVGQLTGDSSSVTRPEATRNSASASAVDLRHLSRIFRETRDSLRLELQNQQRERADLESAARFLDTILEAMIEGVIVVDSDHRVVYANTAASRLLGDSLRPREMKNRHLLEIVRHKKIDQSLRRVLHDQKRVRSEFDLPRSQLTVSLVATRLIRDQEAAAVLVLHNVTELRRLENVRREFVSNVSHELKTPLASIQAYVETLLHGAMNDPDTCGRFLDRIDEQAQRLHELIHDLLHLARIESGQEAFDIRDVSVREAITGCIDECQPRADSQGIIIDVDQHAEDVPVRADAGGLRIIVDNLVSNAIKYTPGEGTVSLSWSLEGDEVRIDVEDSGAGIPKDHLPRIFERFYRTDEARSRDVGGTGLGLAIVKHLTQVFGGRITVDSEVGRGSRFSVHLPRAQ